MMEGSLSLFRVGTGLRLEEMRNVNKGGMKSSVAPKSRRKLRPHQERSIIDKMPLNSTHTFGVPTPPP